MKEDCKENGQDYVPLDKAIGRRLGNETLGENLGILGVL